MNDPNYYPFHKVRRDQSRITGAYIHTIPIRVGWKIVIPEGGATLFAVIGDTAYFTTAEAVDFRIVRDDPNGKR